MSSQERNTDATTSDLGSAQYGRPNRTDPRARAERTVTDEPPTGTSAASSDRRSEVTTDSGRNTDRRGTDPADSGSASEGRAGDDAGWREAGDVGDGADDRHGVRTDECPECGGKTVTDRTRGERLCRECGLVVDERVLDRRPSRRDRDPENETRRVGSPTTPRFHDDGLATVIDDRDVDANDRVLDPRKRRRMRRLRLWNRRFLTRNPGERSLQFGLGELARMASALDVSDGVRETASVVLRRAHDADVHRGRSMEATVAAALFAAVRQAGLPLTMSDVSEPSRVDDRAFERAYRDLMGELSLQLAPPDPADHVSKLASELSLDEALQRRAGTLLDCVKARDEHVGKHPDGLAAAALYAAALIEDVELTQDDLASVADTSTVTIRKHYRKMLDAWREDAGVE